MGKLKAFVALFIVVGGGYLCWALIPPYFHKYQLQDELDEIARRNAYTHKTDDEVKAIVIEKASSLDIPLKEEQIIVSRSSDGLGITVRYHIHVDIPVHPVDLDFTAASIERRI